MGIILGKKSPPEPELITVSPAPPEPEEPVKPVEPEEGENEE
jgi:hypothetical protein